jgi:hypothetical protein
MKQNGDLELKTENTFKRNKKQSYIAAESSATHFWAYLPRIPLRLTHGYAPPAANLLSCIAAGRIQNGHQSLVEYAALSIPHGSPTTRTLQFN